MTHTRNVYRIALLGLVLLGILVLSQAGIARAAAPTELFFSEYIEGSSNNKALEIYNGTGAAVDLAAGGYNVQMFFNGSATSGLTINLTGTVADGDVFVIAQSSADAAILAQADQTNGAGWFNGNDAVVLRKVSTIIDSIGQTGFNPGTEWGSSLTSTADNTLQRKDTICTGDTNATDLFDPATEWNGFASNTFSGLGTHTASCGVVVDIAPSVSSTIPSNGGTNIAISDNIQITFSEPVTVSGDWFGIQCDFSGSVSATASGSLATYTLDPVADFVPGEQCAVTIYGANVADQDEPVDLMANDHRFDFTTFLPVSGCGDPATLISAVQGSGLESPVAGSLVVVEGVVVGDFEGPSPTWRGFYLQNSVGDGDTATSDGIFVFNGSNNSVNAGDIARVRGFVSEFNGQTQISSSGITTCGTGSVSPTEVTFPVPDLDYLERFEGMLVVLPQDLVIAEYFNYDRFGEMVLGLPVDGEPRPFTPTAVVEPGAPAIARALENTLRRITLDDGLNQQNPPVVRHPNGDPFSLTNLFRGGDTVTNTTGVLGYAFNLYRIQPTAPADYAATNPRPTAPPEVGGRLTVASFNVLNYFTTLDDGVNDICGPLSDQECRGADNQEEFERQRAKIMAALSKMDADVIGLIELENNADASPAGDGTDPVLEDIVAGLNDIMGTGTYAFIDAGVIGTDAIKVAFIYKPATVTPVGSFAILDESVDFRFLDEYNRPVLAQTFVENATGSDVTVAVNHLKSKGSDCNDVGDPDLGDGQGNCNLTRLAAAQALVDWMAADPTGTGDPDSLIIGDLNSYDKEDPIDAILAGSDDVLGTGDDFTDLVYKYGGEYAYSYVFDGQAGYLDHALANASMALQVTGASAWHINADEPDLIDYDTSFKPPAQDVLFEPNEFRSSDHDPILIGLDLFDFDGFFGSVKNPPKLNKAKAGSAIPLIFTLNGDYGLGIFANGYPASREIDCQTKTPLGDYSLVDSNGLSYDPYTDRYTFVWKSEKSWSGTCREVSLTFVDGTEATAWFRFK